jgi:hypothetical protein
MRKKLVHNVTLGADIEVFLKNKETGEVVSAEGLIKGSKEFPFFFMDDNPFFATSLDNIMAEFCIPPAKNSADFRSSIETAIGYITDNIPKDLSVFAFPAARIDGKYLQTENAMLFGCHPDFDAWRNGSMNERPGGALSNLRSCGGHIHVGYDDPDMATNLQLIKAMDIFVGLPSVLQEPDNDRKSLYGKAGAFRFKDYGVEYRTISNYYINSPELTHWAFDNTTNAVEFVNQDNKISRTEADGIQLAINKADKQLAEELCKYFGVKLAA